MASSVTVLGSNNAAVVLNFDSESNLTIAQQLANRINASITGGSRYVTAFDNLPPPQVPSGYEGGYYQTTSGSGGMPTGYSVDLVQPAGNAFVTSSGLPNEIIMSDAEVNLQFSTGNKGSGTVVGGGGISVFTIDAQNAGNWLLFSGAGDDLISAYGKGNDTINAGDGNNTLLLGSGNDSVISSGNDVIVGPLTGAGGTETIDALNAHSTVVRTNKADLYFLGGAGGATIFGGSGSDTYYGGAQSGSQLIRGGSAGKNYLLAGGGPATLFGGGNGDQLLAKGALTQTLVAGAGNETLSALASTGNDSLVAGSGKTLLLGNAGADTFVGGSGQATIQVGSSANTFEFIRGESGGKNLVQYVPDTSDIRIHLEGYAASETAKALASQTVKQGSLTISLSDGTTVTFEDISQKLGPGNFT